MLAVDEQTGTIRWRYVTGFPTDRAPAVVGDRVYVASERPELHCLDAATGIQQWEADGISQFAAASKSHIYGIDQYGAITEADAKTGAVTGRLQTGEMMTALVNDKTDRLYLITGHGLVQCLHEIGAKQPLHYGEEAAAGIGRESESGGEKQAARHLRRNRETPPAEKPAPAQPKPESENPFGARSRGGENPFGAAAPAAAPATSSPKPAAPAAAPSDDDPFGS